MLPKYSASMANFFSRSIFKISLPKFWLRIMLKTIEMEEKN